ncbi:MAG TPA: hypothetical protein VFH95_16545 [Candidatus Kapabacteria bacterium]|nr:hypothetical protein [Candidatus Kapabacteria bacterium]
MSHNTVIKLLFVLLICSAFGCKSSTSPNSSSTPSGTLIFGEPIDEVVDAGLGSNTSSVLFHGDDPSFAPGGRIIWTTNWNYTSSGTASVVVSSLDGQNAQTVVDFQEAIGTVPAHPKMSPDGKYVSVNYSDFLGGQLGTHFGTLIYSSSGTQLWYIDSLWDASWAPDGSLVLSGSVTGTDLVTRTYISQGLFKVDKNFSSITSIGSGLTQPQFPSVSPDGTKISFAMNGHIWVIGMDGTGLKQVTSGPNTETYSAWSPDGSEIAAESAVATGTALAIVSTRSSTPTDLSLTSAVWVADKNNSVGLIDPQGNVDWRQ